MNEAFVISCSCGQHDFVFPRKPWCKTEVKCPECKETTVYDPEATVDQVEPTVLAANDEEDDI